jgi:hypothetical protein
VYLLAWGRSIESIVDWSLRRPRGLSRSSSSEYLSSSSRRDEENPPTMSGSPGFSIELCAVDWVGAVDWFRTTFSFWLFLLAALRRARISLASFSGEAQREGLVDIVVSKWFGGLRLRLWFGGLRLQWGRLLKSGGFVRNGAFGVKEFNGGINVLALADITVCKRRVQSRWIAKATNLWKSRGRAVELESRGSHVVSHVTSLWHYRCIPSRKS